MPSFPNQFDVGSYVPTTDVFDTQIIYEMDINSQQFKEFLVRLRQNINNIANVLKTKDTGYYMTDKEFVTGSQYFPNPLLNSTTGQTPVMRQVFRKTVNFGALPNATTKSVPHNLTINNAYKFVRIYACASDLVAFSYLPIPYASSTAADIIEINVDATNVNITTASDKTAYTEVYVVVEYIKQ